MRTGMLVLTLLSVTTPLAAQRAALREVRHRDRGSWGATFTVAKPLGDFRRTGNEAYGLNGFVVTGGPLLGWRFDGSWMVYDATYQGYGVRTTSQIGSLAFGPQITVGQGPVSVYGFVTAGPTMFWSNASFNDGCGCDDDYFLDGDLTWTKSAGAGMLIEVARRRTPIAIDFSLRGVRHDRVEYVPAGGLTQNQDGTFSGQRVRTPVDLRVFQIGVSIGIR
jgi:hypothetical protein